jgi:hypothetical protein
MELEPAGSPQIRVTCGTSTIHYDLRLYTPPEFIVPAWWIGVFDIDPAELKRTEVLDRSDQATPGEVFHWLVPIVGQQIAGDLVSSAAKVISSRSAAIS